MSLYNISISVAVKNMRALHYVIVTSRVATGSRLVPQLLHTGHYEAPPKPPKNVTRWKIGVNILVSFIDTTTVL